MTFSSSCYVYYRFETKRKKNKKINKGGFQKHLHLFRFPISKLIDKTQMGQMKECLNRHLEEKQQPSLY